MMALGAGDGAPGAGDGAPNDGSSSSASEPLRVLRRIERLMVVFWLLGVVLWLVFLGGFGNVLILTLAAAAGIVSFRGLQRLVWQIGAREAGDLDRRPQILAGLRFVIILLLPAVSLWLTTRQTLALIAGFSSLPLALITEGLSQFVRAPNSEPTNGI